MKRILKYVSILLTAVLVVLGITACSPTSKQSTESTQVQDLSFDQLKEKSKGTTVNFYGYGGSELTNNWVDKELAPMVQKNYDIKLNRVGMNIDEVLNLMINEDKAVKISTLLKRIIYYLDHSLISYLTLKNILMQTQMMLKTILVIQQNFTKFLTVKHNLL